MDNSISSIMETKAKRQSLPSSLTGWDLLFLSQFALGNSCRDRGSSKGSQEYSFGNLMNLGNGGRFNFLSMTSGYFRSLLNTLRQSHSITIYFLLDLFFRLSFE